jgi:hypothetical protein
MTLNLISDSLYFGDYSHRNTLVRGHIGGVSGGKIYMTGRHVDIDGKITANGKSPDTQLGNNAGKKMIYVKIVKMISLIVRGHLSLW